MEKIRDYIRHTGIPFLRVLPLAILCALCCASCKTRYVTVPEYHTVYTRNTDTFMRSDTTFIRDSVVIRMRGDSTVVEKIRWRDRLVNVYRLRTDTVMRTDSIRVPCPVERRLSKWERLKMDYGGVSMGITLALALFVIIWLAKRIRDKI